MKPSYLAYMSTSMHCIGIEYYVLVSVHGQDFR